MNFRPTCLLPAAPLLLALAGLGTVALAQGDPRIEVQELKATLQVSAAQIQDLENKAGRLKEQINALSDSLASANADSLQAREAYQKLRLQMEGLGIAALDASSVELQQRLLSALSDLRILEGHRRALTEALVGLSEASLAYAKSAPSSDAPVKEGLNKALIAGEKALGGTKLSTTDGAAGSDLDDARVVSLKDDLGIAVLNVGSRHGVHPGMPIAIFRKDKPVARALVVDVRQSICGALVRDLVSKDEPVKIGDTGRVQTSKG
jgi:hypothetical protein